LGKVYFLIGLIGFGPALAAEMKRRLVEERHWLSETDFLNGLALSLSQMLPGATFVSLTVYGGYKLRGIAGALISFFSFLVSPFAIMLFLSYIYFTYGALPAVSLLFRGVAVVVTGLVAQAVLSVGKPVVTDSKAVLVTLAAAGVMFVYPNIFLLLFLAAISGIILYYPPLKRQSSAQNVTVSVSSSTLLFVGCTRFFLIAAVLAMIACVLYGQPVLRQLGWVFFKMGAFLFGGGFSMLPFIQQEVVSHYHWLTIEEFLVGIALGQVTPGPITILATFVGYKVAALSGAVAATLGIYLPSLFLVMITAEFHQKIRHNLWVKAALKGMLGAFTGMMIFLVIGMAQHALHDLFSVFWLRGLLLSCNSVSGILYGLFPEALRCTVFFKCQDK
jgi:chromate transporter